MNGSEGIVKNAKLEGDLGSTGGAIQITYYVENDDGEVIEIPMKGLEKA